MKQKSINSKIGICFGLSKTVFEKQISKRKNSCKFTFLNSLFEFVKSIKLFINKEDY